MRMARSRKIEVLLQLVSLRTPLIRGVVSLRVVAVPAAMTLVSAYLYGRYTDPKEE